MESIFENFDLGRFCLGRSVGDVFTCSSRSWGIGMEVFVCAAACKPVPIIGGKSKSPAGMLSNHGYAALWKRIRTVAHTTAIGGEADQLDSYEFDTRPFDSTIELALSALTVQNDGTELTRTQIIAMHALWTFDEALSTGTNLGWCDETIDALVRAMSLAKDVNTEGQKTTGVVDSEIEAVIKAQKREQARRGGLARQENNKRLKTKALALYRAQTWTSMRQASIAIAPLLAEYARENSIPRLSIQRGQLTIYEWILDEVRESEGS